MKYAVSQSNSHYGSDADVEPFGLFTEVHVICGKADNTGTPAIESEDFVGKIDNFPTCPQRGSVIRQSNMTHI